MSFKLCMIGCGSFARLCHGPAQQLLANRNRDVVLAACCDAEGARAEEYRSTFGFERDYGNTAEMLASERPDAIVMAVPPAVAAATGTEVLRAGVPLLLEKPPGTNVPELQHLLDAAGEVPVQVAFNRRYMPVLRAALAQLDTELPPSAVARIDYEMVRSARWDEDFSTTAIHAVDALLLLARASIASVVLRFQPQHEGGRFAANIDLEAETSGGTRLALHVLPVGGRNAESVRIHGPGRTLFVGIPASPLSDELGCVKSWSGGRAVTAFPDRGLTMVERMGVYGELAAFVGAVRRGIPPSPSLADCRAQVTIMAAIRARCTGTVPLDFT